MKFNYSGSDSALTRTIQKWGYEKKQEKTTQEALKLLDMKFNFGKRLYTDRDELHERYCDN